MYVRVLVSNATSMHRAIQSRVSAHPTARPISDAGNCGLKNFCVL